jgi:mono/diheme cytochrome c family protein
MKKVKMNPKVFIALLFAFVLMAGAGNLNAQDVWKAPPEADKLVNPLKGKPEAVKAGKKLFKNQCVVCHGVRGRGDGVAGMGLNPKPADLTSKAVQDQTDGAIFWKITNGKTPMAAYKDVFTEEQRWELVTYIRTLKKK